MKPLDAGPFPSLSQTTLQDLSRLRGRGLPAAMVRGEDASRLFDTDAAAAEPARRRAAGRGCAPARAARPSRPGRSGRFGLETLFDQRMRETWGGLTFSRRLSDSVGLGGTRLRRPPRPADTLGGEPAARLRRRQRGLRPRHRRLQLHALAPARQGRGRLGGGGHAARPRRDLPERGAVRQRQGRIHAVRGRREPRRRRESAERCSSTASTRTSTRATGPRGRWREAAPGGAAASRSTPPRSGSRRWTGSRCSPGWRTRASARPSRSSRTCGSVVNAGVGAEYWLGGVSANQGPRRAGTALYGAFATDFSASPDVVPRRGGQLQPELVSHHRRHRLRGREQPLQPRRQTTPSAARSATSRSAAFRPSLPVIAEGRRVAVRSTRWVFVLGYLFGPRR